MYSFFFLLQLVYIQHTTTTTTKINIYLYFFFLIYNNTQADRFRFSSFYFLYRMDDLSAQQQQQQNYTLDFFRSLFRFYLRINILSTIIIIKIYSNFKTSERKRMCMKFGHIVYLDRENRIQKTKNSLNFDNVRPEQPTTNYSQRKF